MGGKGHKNKPGGRSTNTESKPAICIRCPDPAGDNVRHSVLNCKADPNDPQLWPGFSVGPQTFTKTTTKECEEFLDAVQRSSGEVERGTWGDMNELKAERQKIKVAKNVVTKSSLTHAFSQRAINSQQDAAAKAAEDQKARQDKQAAKAQAKNDKEAAEKKAADAKFASPAPVLSIPDVEEAPTRGNAAPMPKTIRNLADPAGLSPEKRSVKYAVRTSFANRTEPLELITNHFEIGLPPGLTLFQYTISSESREFEDATKNKLKVFMRDAIKGCDQLRDHYDEIATDNTSKIVSGRDLGIDRAGIRVTVKSYHRGTREEPTDVELFVKLEQTFDMDSLKNYVEGGDMTYEEKGAAEAMNILVAKAVSDGSETTFQAGNNKFYYRNGWNDIQVHGNANPEGLIAMRGYYCSVRPAMGMVTMNTNTVTSAFYKPQLLEEYLKRLVQPRSQVSTEEHTRQLREANDHLAGRRVYVNFDRGTEDDRDIDAPHRRTKTIHAIDQCATELKFVPKGKSPGKANKVTVWDHLNQKYPNVDHGSPDQLSVNVGGKGDNHKYYLPHHLIVVSDQIYRGKLPAHLLPGMIDAARRRPTENRAVIMNEGLKSLRLNEASSMLAKLKISVGTSMLQIQGRRAPRPTVRYIDPRRRGDKVVAADKIDQAGWMTRDMAFVETPRPWGNAQAAVHFIAVNDPNHPLSGKFPSGTTLTSYRNAFMKGFIRWHKSNGLQPFKMNESAYTAIGETEADWNEANVSNAIKKITSDHPNVKLIVLMLPSKSAKWAGRYATFKTICDQTHGITSTVFCEESIIGSTKRKSHDPNPSSDTLESRDHQVLAGYMSNIAAKLNLRLGGTNHTLHKDDFFGVLGPDPNSAIDCIIMGADVTHPSGNSINGTPSLAAVVGSVDDKFGMFPGSMRCQTSRQEQIADMKSMAQQCFYRWSEKQTGGGSKYKLPKKILFYRDGVSEGQYNMVLTQEVAHIATAWEEICRLYPEQNPGLPSTPEITAVVVAKRHHTRFFPKDKDGTQFVSKTGNLKPGTLVDSTITNPYYHDFYLQSHHSLQGTAKPAHYFVLKNGMNFTEEQLQNLTNNLCYTYGKSCNAVSYAPPAYYADRLCERGRQYLKPFFDGKYDLRDLDEDQVEQKVAALWNRGGKNGGNPWHPRLNNTMFWM